MCLHCRYRQAFMWEDKTVEYFAAITLEAYRRPDGLKCTALGSSLGSVSIIKCRTSGVRRTQGEHDWFMCQMPDRGRGQYAQPLPSSSTWFSLAIVNTTTVTNSRQWSPAMCPDGHATHVFLACDVSTFCWAGRNMTFSLRSEFWALPTAQSCQVQLPVTPLPPSFPCESDAQRVPYSLVCDHKRDCADNSDETFCSFLPCQWQHQIQCLNKQVCCLR